MEIFLQYLDGLEKPKLSGSMERNQLISFFKSQPYCSQVTINLLDHNYCFYSREQLVAFLKKINLRQINYRPEAFDCDDFAYTARTCESLWLRNTRLPKHTTAFGTVVGDLRFGSTKNEHSMNIFVDDQRKVWLYEPQTGEIYGLDRLKVGSYIVSIVM